MRLFWLALLGAALIGGQNTHAPLATFHGAVHGVSNKKITIETAAGNLVDFDINHKTKILRGRRQIAAAELQTGDPVAIDARQEFGEYLIAVVITAQPKN